MPRLVQSAELVWCVALQRTILLIFICNNLSASTCDLRRRLEGLGLKRDRLQKSF